MTSTQPTDDAPVLADFPMARASGCPFDPPPEMYTAQRDGGGKPVRVRMVDGNTPWLVTKFEHQRQLLADPRISNDATAPGFPMGFPITREMVENIGFIMMDAPEHSRLRKMVTAPFTVRKIEAMRPRVQELVDQQIDKFLTCEKPADLVENFALPVPSFVICELLGVPYADHEFFQTNSTKMVSMHATDEERGLASMNLVNFLTELLERKAKEPADDVLSGLVPRIEAGDLTPLQAAQQGMLLLFAGHETTANMISLGTLALLRNPEQLAYLRETDDPEKVSMAVEELLRYLNITYNGPKRVAAEDIELDGVVIGKGEGVIMPSEMGNRDPETFEEPDRLDLSRGVRRHLAFSFGVHQCLGQPLARLELQVVYGTLYKRVPTLDLAIPFEDVKFKSDAFVYGVHELPVTW